MVDVCAHESMMCPPRLRGNRLRNSSQQEGIHLAFVCVVMQTNAERCATCLICRKFHRQLSTWCVVYPPWWGGNRRKLVPGGMLSSVLRTRAVVVLIIDWCVGPIFFRSLAAASCASDKLLARRAYHNHRPRVHFEYEYCIIIVFSNVSFWVCWGGVILIVVVAMLNPYRKSTSRIPSRSHAGHFCCVFPMIN